MVSPDPAFLREEYFQLQKTVETFDERALTIKAWSVTFSMAGIGTAFARGLPTVFLLSALASALFWLIEGYWKLFQQAYYPRIREIEEFMAGRVENVSSPRIASSWLESWRRTSVLRVLFWPHVFLPHAVVVAGGLVLWLLTLAGVMGSLVRP